ncbi:MAG: hypothetical protein KAQ99_04070 [Candidatus Aureabacteria bacterium]|nr:hypothetical protein [Candidatus Auribacterota bacterium]MCK5160730.1 hypothetical protein [Candidatus Auribacterota bacterium]
MPCVNHPNKAAAWKCRQCGTEYCDNCVKKISIKQTFTCVCPKCGEMCEVYKGSPGNEKSELGDETSRSLTQVFDAFVVPFRKGGLLVLLFGTFLLVGADFLIKFGCMLGFAGIFAKFMVYSYVMRVIADAASGEKVLPFWTFDDIWNDVVGPGFRMIFLAVVALLPAAACLMGFAVTKNPVLMIPGITNLFAFYCWLVTGQMLGTLYYCEEEKLWG